MKNNVQIKLLASNWIAERLEKGKEEYNDELDVHDGRDWIKEAKEELTDAVVYMAAFELQNENLYQMINKLKSENDSLKEDIAVLKNKKNTDVLTDGIEELQIEMDTLDNAVGDVMSVLNNLVDSIKNK